MSSKTNSSTFNMDNMERALKTRPLKPLPSNFTDDFSLGGSSPPQVELYSSMKNKYPQNKQNGKPVILSILKR